MDASTIILGFTGSLGSGCTYISEFISKVSDGKIYRYYKLSSIIRDILSNEGKTDPTVEELQDKGNELRRNNSNGYLVGALIDKINKDPNVRNGDAIIIDGIKNEGEIKTLRQFPFFFLFSVQSNDENRLNRYKKNKVVNSDAEFEKVDSRDKFEEFDYGQQVKRCNYLADIIILNQNIISKADSKGRRRFVRDIYEKYVKLVEALAGGDKSVEVMPSIDELCMTTAYVMSKMSSCIKRKVGSIIVDKNEKLGIGNRGQITAIPNIVSSGYNEVPIGSYSCIFHPQYQMCYRDYLQEKHAKKLKYCPNCGEQINISIECPYCNKIHDTYIKFCPESQKEIEDKFKCSKCDATVFKDFLPGEKNTPGKLLDMCRALHAEELALLNLIKSGKSSQQNLTLYVTTQPCNLCANKIVSAGIKKVVFDEPYFMKESAEILTQGGVAVERFQGVKSSAYFKLY